MSRERTRSSPELPAAFMELCGAAGGACGGAVQLEPEEELLSSVSDITEHLRRNVAAVLRTAELEIRRAVGVRMQLLRTELRDKNAEIQRLRAQLETLQPEPPTKLPFSLGGSKHSGADPRRAKAVIPEVKRENIDAICGYLMKDKNSRGAELDAQPEVDSLTLWSDGKAPGDSDSTSDELFMPAVCGRRLYECDWTAPELRDVKSPEYENTRAAVLEDQENAAESSRREASGPKQSQVSFSHVQLSDCSMEGDALEDAAVRLETGQQFTSHTYICSLCGTFCPDSAFLEDHIKLIHPHADDEPTARPRTFLSSAGAAAEDVSSDSARVAKAPGEGGRDVAVGLGGVSVRKEIKTEGGYECGDCGRHFNYLGNLRQHQRIHTGEKPFMCPDCGERFRHAARLKSHRLVHSGAQSPFPCPQCGKGFSVLSGLKRHQRVHTGESPYACPECGRCFKELGNLYTHQRIHSGATPYCCQHCGRCFRHLGTYKSHRCSPAP